MATKPILKGKEVVAYRKSRSNNKFTFFLFKVAKLEIYID